MSRYHQASRLRRSVGLGDWYVLDTEGTGCQSQPEGTRYQWTSLLDKAELASSDLGKYGFVETIYSFNRVGARMRRSTPVFFEFYSPRDATSRGDFVLVSVDEFPAMRVVLGADRLTFESVDQGQIEGDK